MTEQELKALCRKWQKRLRLLDWDINVEFKHRHELATLSRHGENEYHLDTKTSMISVLYENELDDYCNGRAETIENIIVHELLELLINPIINDKYQTDKEQAINMIADALVGFELYKTDEIDEILSEYDFSKGERGKYVARCTFWGIKNITEKEN